MGTVGEAGGSRRLTMAGYPLAPYCPALSPLPLRRRADPGRAGPGRPRVWLSRGTTRGSAASLVVVRLTPSASHPAPPRPLIGAPVTQLGGAAGRGSSRGHPRAGRGGAVVGRNNANRTERAVRELGPARPPPAACRL